MTSNGYVFSWYKYLGVILVFSHPSVYEVGAPFPDHCPNYDWTIKIVFTCTKDNMQTRIYFT